METLTNVVWITGASSGIGKALAAKFASEGHPVAISSRNPERLKAAAEELRNSGLTVLAVPCDISDGNEVNAAAKAIGKKLGEVTVLINNAGTSVFKPFTESTIEEFDRLVATNLRGPFLCTQAVLPSMLERGEGSIVMINSIASRDVFPDSSLYSATKAGLKALADGLRLEVRKQGLRVISVYPGATATEIWPEKLLEKYGHKMMRVEDVAQAVFHTCNMPPSIQVEDYYLQPVGGGI